MSRRERVEVPFSKNTVVARSPMIVVFDDMDEFSQAEYWL